MIIKLSILPPYIQRSCKEWGLLWCGRHARERYSAAWWTEQVTEGFLWYLKVVGSKWRLNEDLNALSTKGCDENSCGVSVKIWVSVPTGKPTVRFESGRPFQWEPGGQSVLSWRTVPSRLTEFLTLESSNSFWNHLQTESWWKMSIESKLRFTVSYGCSFTRPKV